MNKVNKETINKDKRDKNHLSHGSFRFENVFKNLKNDTSINTSIIYSSICNICLIGILSFSMNSNAHAQAVPTSNAGASSGIAINISSSLSQLSSLDTTTLESVGCNQDVWNKMINDYALEAQRHVAVANQMQVQNQVMATPELVTACYDQAVQIINNASKAYNTIMSFLSGGGFDTGALKEYAKKVVINEACSQVNNYISQTGIGSMVNQGTGLVNGMLDGSALGQIGAIGNTPIYGSDIINNSGFTPNNSNNIPTLNSGDLSGIVGGGFGGAINNGSSSGGGFWSSINPFK